MKGKKIVITGGSSGIGAALCQTLTQQGAEVISLSRSLPKSLLQLSVKHIKTDLRKPSEIKAAFQNIGTFDILINNAGIAYLSSIISGTLDEWDEMWETNVRALALCSQLALHQFPLQGGQIINISSMSGHRVPPSGGFYSPTKFAVKALTASLRIELKNIQNPTRVSSISPGFVDTPLLDTYFKGREKDLKKTKDIIAMLSPADIAQQVQNIIHTPLHVEVGDISLRSSSQSV